MKRSWSNGITVIALLFCVSCDNAVIGTLDTIEGILSVLRQNRTLIEAYARDIQQATRGADSSYENARSSYEFARERTEQFLSALQIESQLGATSDTPKLAEEVAQAQTEFMATATRLLAPTVNVRSLNLSKLVESAPHVVPLLRQLPPERRQRAIARIQTEMRVRPWSEYRAARRD